MRTTVVVHADGWASYVRWVDALSGWCRSVGQGMTAEMIDELALDELEMSQGHPESAKLVSTRSNGDELWTWQIYAHTRISYIIRERRSWAGTRERRVMIVEYETTLPGESS